MYYDIIEGLDPTVCTTHFLGYPSWSSGSYGISAILRWNNQTVDIAYIHMIVKRKAVSFICRKKRNKNQELIFDFISIKYVLLLFLIWELKFHYYIVSCIPYTWLFQSVYPQSVRCFRECLYIPRNMLTGYTCNNSQTLLTTGQY